MVGRRKGKRQIRKGDVGESTREKVYQSYQHGRLTNRKGAISHGERSYVQQAPFDSMDIHSGFY